MVKLRIREIAEARKWNAAKLARRADLSNTAVYAIWNGETTDPGLQTLGAIARALGVSISDLYEEVDGGGRMESESKTHSLAAPLLAS
jgi:transcriptional regulator with XRE-family HTH domain